MGRRVWKGNGELNGCSEGWLTSSVGGRRRWNCVLRTRAIDDERKEMAGNSRPNLPRSCLLGRVGGRSWKLGRLIGCKGSVVELVFFGDGPVTLDLGTASSSLRTDRKRPPPPYKSTSTQASGFRHHLSPDRSPLHHTRQDVCHEKPAHVPAHPRHDAPGARKSLSSLLCEHPFAV